MSAPNIGEEFEKAVSGRDDERVEGLEKKIALLSHLSRNPCSTSSEIANALGISERGVLWHLKAMERSDFVGELAGSRRRFFIKMHVREGDCELISLLKERKVRDLIRDLLENPGTCQKSIAESLNISRQSAGKLLKRMVHTGILAETRDGRRTRYYMTKRLSEMRKFYEERRESASERIRNIVGKLGIGYEINLERDGMLYLKIRDNLVRFGTDPVISVLGD